MKCIQQNFDYIMHYGIILSDSNNSMNMHKPQFVPGFNFYTSAGSFNIPNINNFIEWLTNSSGIDQSSWFCLDDVLWFKSEQDRTIFLLRWI